MIYKFSVKIICSETRAFTQDLEASIYKASKKEKGYWGKVNALPGCVSQGDTLKEMKQNIKEAAELWLEVECDKSKK